MGKLYRGISLGEFKRYQKDGIPKGSLFTNLKKDAKMYNTILIEVNKNKDFKEVLRDNYVFKELGMKTRYFKNKCIIFKYKQIK